MRVKKWLILAVSLLLVLLASSIGVTSATLVDVESSSGNTFQAWTVGVWTQTTQVDFEAGITSDTLDVQVGANNRDAWDDTNSGSLDMCYFGDTDWWDTGGYQWSLSIPQGATINAAYISVYPAWHGGATGAYTAGIRVEDVDDPLAFSGAGNNIRGRSYWSTTVDWSIPAGGLPASQWNDSPSITALVQHAVDNPGWSEGDYISIAVWGETGNGGCGEGVTDFSSNPSYAARLHVEYSTATVDTTTSPGDVKLIGQSAQSVVASDNFEGGWSGGSGWLWGWWHEGNSAITTSGGPHGGSYHLRMTSSNAYVDRAVDLSGRTDVRLQFWAKANSFEYGESAECYIYDGVDWHVVETWVNGDDDNVYHFHDIDLSSFNMSSQFYVCFDTDMSSAFDYLYIDDIELVAAGGVTYNSLGTLASQVLDTGVPGTNWNTLFWDEILESSTDITFEVRASDSLNGG